ncbi:MULTISPECIES: hypothetical protein [Methylomonas]|uniref:Outer-membrane lipoprotein LolB n=2 Tax=Methylomonas TaxID=416 RepID=A0A140E5A2_9GAMM|nr:MULTISPECIES: hypothetical protein [Methylomonas]AMK75576.1 hypothetical protein JT25_003585 [Methylomonas denitrificans]OAI09193.1 hypothetical protein A1342_08340 [Methylomonas methanica]TCV79073.1 hypothetical protein EDE11_12250 [Methylomonas methanica]
MFNTIFKFLSKLFALGLLIVLTACSHVPAKHAADTRTIDLSSASLPAIAAEFVTTRTGEEHEHEEHEPLPAEVSWRFWRDSQQITIERPQLGLGELWQRDGQELIHRKLYHQDRRAIEFQAGDLRMLDITPSWQKLALLLDSQLLDKLTADEIEWTDGIPTREYQGKVADTEWHVVMRLDVALPMLIERRHGEFSERTELLQAYPLNAAPWQPTPVNGYDVIDFADLGDKESDPFVIKVQAQMGHEHHH